MKVDPHIQTEVSNTLHPLYYGFQLGRAIQPPERCCAVHLDRPESLRNSPLRRLGHFTGGISSDPGIYGNVVTHASTEQLPHGHTQCLAFEVPQRLIEPGQGRHEHRSAAVETQAVRSLPE